MYVFPELTKNSLYNQVQIKRKIPKHLGKVILKDIFIHQSWAALNAYVFVLKIM